jgi:hypothetical protein
MEKHLYFHIEMKIHLNINEFQFLPSERPTGYAIPTIFNKIPSISTYLPSCIDALIPLRIALVTRMVKYFELVENSMFFCRTLS